MVRKDVQQSGGMQVPLGYFQLESEDSWMYSQTLQLIASWPRPHLLDPVPKPDCIRAYGLSLLAGRLRRCSSNQIHVYYKHKAGEIKGKYFCAES